MQTKDFSIVVYGRTEAGKSTLMEILTCGNGDSIGKGGQRTTLDVRDYYWQGLKITDVPGISAFGGKKELPLCKLSIRHNKIQVATLSIQILNGLTQCLPKVRATTLSEMH